MASSVGHLCRVCIAASIAHKRHILALKREIIETSQHPPTSPTPLQNKKKTAHRTFKVKHYEIIKHWHGQERHTQTHNREVQQGWRVVKAFIFCSKGKDPPDIPEGTDQSRPDWFKLFVLGSTSITIWWSSVSDYSTGLKKKERESTFN